MQLHHLRVAALPRKLLRYAFPVCGIGICLQGDRQRLIPDDIFVDGRRLNPVRIPCNPKIRIICSGFQFQHIHIRFHHPDSALHPERIAVAAAQLHFNERLAGSRRCHHTAFGNRRNLLVAGSNFQNLGGAYRLPGLVDQEYPRGLPHLDLDALVNGFSIRILHGHVIFQPVDLLRGILGKLRRQDDPTHRHRDIVNALLVCPQNRPVHTQGICHQVIPVIRRKIHPVFYGIARLYPGLFSIAVFHLVDVVFILGFVRWSNPDLPARNLAVRVFHAVLVFYRIFIIFFLGLVRVLYEGHFILAAAVLVNGAPRPSDKLKFASRLPGRKRPRRPDGQVVVFYLHPAQIRTAGKGKACHLLDCPRKRQRSQTVASLKGMPVDCHPLSRFALEGQAHQRRTALKGILGYYGKRPAHHRIRQPDTAGKRIGTHRFQRRIVKVYLLNFPAFIKCVLPDPFQTCGQEELCVAAKCLQCGTALKGMGADLFQAAVIRVLHINHIQPHIALKCTVPDTRHSLRH